VLFYKTLFSHLKLINQRNNYEEKEIPELYKKVEELVKFVAKRTEEVK
jgi:hypothetical protein